MGLIIGPKCPTAVMDDPQRREEVDLLCASARAYALYIRSCARAWMLSAVTASVAVHPRGREGYDVGVRRWCYRTSFVSIPRSGFWGFRLIAVTNRPKWLDSWFLQICYYEGSIL